MTILTWDEPKRLANLDKHKLDFRSLTMEFFEKATIMPTRKGRFIAIGGSTDRTVSVIFAPLGQEALAIISMRFANPRERRLVDGT